MNQYCIKDNYVCNLTQNNEPVAIYTVPPMSKLYQVPVYLQVQRFLKTNPQCSVLELGSGTGYKLNKYIRPFALEVTGADQAVCTDFAKAKFPGIHWIEFDLEGPTKKFGLKEADVIISADVIEHLVDPDKLLALCTANAHKQTRIFLSTPERDLVRGKKHHGPPPNQLHIREWNFDEFAAYLKSNGLIVEKHVVMPDRKRTLKDIIRGNPTQRTCQLAICRVAQ